MSSESMLRPSRADSEILITRFDFNQPLLILCTISALISLSVFILSMLDLGQPSMYTALATPLLTLIFYITLYILGRLHRLHQRRQIHHHNPKVPVPRTYSQTCTPVYSIPSIICASTFSALWTVPFLMTLWVVLEDSVPTLRYNIKTPPVYKAGDKSTVLVQAVLSGVNIILIGVIAVFFGLARAQRLRSLDLSASATSSPHMSRKGSRAGMGIENAHAA